LFLRSEVWRLKFSKGGDGMKKTIPRAIVVFLFFSFLLDAAILSAAQIRMTWDPNQEPNVAGYKIFYGTESQNYEISIDVGKKTDYTLTGLTAGKRYYWAIKTYDSLKKESGFSKEISGIATDAVTNVTPVPDSPRLLSQATKEGAAPKTPKGEIAADSDQYVIGAEDVLYIHVWREDPLSRSIPVRIDGKISMPLIDEIEATGLTPKQLKENIAEKLKKFIDNPVVSVTVMEANSFRVFVSGQVRNPGVYRLRSETTILQIIPMAGGFTEWANQKKILIVRKESGKEKHINVNYKKIIDGKDSASNYILKSGDTIIVP